MKTQCILIFLSLPFFLMGQRTLSMAEVEGRQELSMSEVVGRTSAGVYRYYASGETVPFTGVLYAKHPNGKFSSWQEYVDGVGQGQWINYYENGNYQEIGNYEQNRVEGPIKKFHPNGMIQAEGTYKEWRIRIGVWKYYDTDGKLLRSENYGEKGSITEVKAYYERGDIPYRWYARILTDNGFEIN